jgi:glutamate synthase (NADPH/NADH) large chain
MGGRAPVACRQTDEAQLKKLLEDHNRWTGSRRARELLDNWSESRGKFVKVFPNEYKRALAERHEREVELVATETATRAASRTAVPAA